MSRLKDADALKLAIDNGWKPDMMVSEIWDIVDEVPAVEAEPVRHGHWIDDSDSYDSYFDCSACGHSWVTIEGTPQDNEMNYCPYCGAHMDEVSE